MLMQAAALCLLLIVVPFSQAYKNGAPSGACTNMDPTGHGSTAQVTTAPFEVIINQGCYSTAAPPQVVVRTKSGYSDEIEGVFVQGRPVSGGSAIGTFSNVNDYKLKTITCNTANSAMTHSDELEHTFIDMRWTPPAEQRSAVKFYATVVKTKAIYWVQIPSSEIIYSSACVPGAIINSASTPRVTMVIVLLIPSTLLAIITR